ncbi:hypothetical protein DWX58_07475 [Pseudoflavonifractor sp. AF19-9AC]|uniref:hypothetical protein n=1 Tax=Pseudoflavonifractor sp. AF19-9AC TaxID=2292244 RepID=UPI000E52C377|nr:hypothetical protein [Pseudoflavonifractor sp. AF19-9AC]RHR10299.1 hypothetical protein DWX58_07475 [Pseudoflavonifractor sp. AF19-9AC]
MGYRNRISRDECLAAALLWTLVLAIQLGFFLAAGRSLDGVSMSLAAVLVLLQVLCCALQWYCYLAYNWKKSNDNNNLGGNPHER